MATLDELAKDEVTEDHKLVNFNKSPIMSTYLLAFIVGDFASIDVSSRSLIYSEAPQAT